MTILLTGAYGFGGHHVQAANGGGTLARGRKRPTFSPPGLVLKSAPLVRQVW